MSWGGLWVVLEFAEICHYVWLVLCINMVLVAGAIWVTPGVTIGNPYGRIALGATTGREEVERQAAWASE